MWCEKYDFHNESKAFSITVLLLADSSWKQQNRHSRLKSIRWRLPIFFQVDSIDCDGGSGSWRRTKIDDNGKDNSRLMIGNGFMEVESRPPSGGTGFSSRGFRRGIETSMQLCRLQGWQFQLL
ncbi:hypothetical protein J6590_024955 [Homalodisca vitripennis]|nr:hypothetical protein J6590_024955 [Homalodisca vitripennis]